MRLSLLAITACGRIHFDPLDDARVDSTITPRCDPMAPFTNIRLIEELSSLYTDGGLRLTDDELEAYLHSIRSGSFEVLRATRTSRQLPFEPPTSFATGQMDSFWPTFSVDGLSLVFNAPDGDLYVSTRTTTAQPFPAASRLASLSTASEELSAAFGRTGSRLYFSRRPADALFETPWPTDGTAQPITSLDGPTFEQAPTLSPDEGVMYFSRATSTAGMEIMVAVRPDAQAPFGTPVPVLDINSPTDDSPTWLSPDLCRLYFETGRTGGFDVYVAERTP